MLLLYYITFTHWSFILLIHVLLILFWFDQINRYEEDINVYYNVVLCNAIQTCVNIAPYIPKGPYQHMEIGTMIQRLAIPIVEGRVVDGWWAMEPSIVVMMEMKKRVTDACVTSALVIVVQTPYIPPLVGLLMSSCPCLFNTWTKTRGISHW